MTAVKKLDLLLKEVEDPKAQENFWRIKNLFESGQLGGGSGQVVNTTILAADFLNRYLIAASEIITIPVGYESVVTGSQTVNGSLTVNGRNTIL